MTPRSHHDRRPLHGEALSPAAMRHEDRVRRAEALAHLMDSRFSVAGIPVGWDAVIGLIPVVGDLAGAAIGLYFLKLAREMDLPRRHRAAMVGNIAIDTALGAVPLLGDLFDIGFRAHRRNARILRRHLERI